MAMIIVQCIRDAGFFIVVFLFKYMLVNSHLTPPTSTL